MVTDIEIYCETLKVLKSLVNSTIKANAKSPNALNKPAISLRISDIQSLTRNIDTPASKTNGKKLENTQNDDKPKEKETKQMSPIISDSCHSGELPDDLIDLRNKLDYRNLRFFSYRLNYALYMKASDMPLKAVIPSMLLKSLTSKLSKYNDPINRNLLPKPQQHVSIIFRLDLIAQFSIYSLIHQLIMRHYQRLKLNQKRVKRISKTPKYILNKGLSLMMKQCFGVPYLPDSMSASCLFTASKWFRDSTLVQFKNQISVKNNCAKIKAATNNSDQNKLKKVQILLEPKQKTPVKLGKQKKITEYFNVSNKEVLLLKPIKVNEPPEPVNNYFAFNLMEPTQFYDQTQQFAVASDSSTKLDQTNSFSESEEIVPTQIIQSGQLQDTELSQPSSESFSCFDQMESIQISPPKSQSSEENKLNTTAESSISKPVFLVPDKIYMEFKPIKYEPQKPKIVYITPSQASQIVPTQQTQFGSTQASIENAGRTQRAVKRRKFMRTGLSKVQRVREPLHSRNTTS